MREKRKGLDPSPASHRYSLVVSQTNRLGPGAEQSRRKRATLRSLSARVPAWVYRKVVSFGEEGLGRYWGAEVDCITGY